MRHESRSATHLRCRGRLVARLRPKSCVAAAGYKIYSVVDLVGPLTDPRIWANGGPPPVAKAHSCLTGALNLADASGPLFSNCSVLLGRRERDTPGPAAARDRRATSHPSAAPPASAFPASFGTIISFHPGLWGGAAAAWTGSEQGGRAGGLVCGREGGWWSGGEGWVGRARSGGSGVEWVQRGALGRGR